MSGDTLRCCPLCGGPADPDERPEAEIAGVVFRSVTCESTDFLQHPFPVRWLESQVPDEQALEDFKDRFTFVRGPLPDGTPIAEAFGDVDPILAWVETEPLDDGIRVLIRL